MHHRKDAESGRGYDEVIIRSIDYEQIAIDCFRYFDFKNLNEVDNLTIPEYKMLVKAYEYKTVDRNYYIHFLAFLNFAVQAQRSAGKGKTKPVYKRFSKFFNYEKEIKRVEEREKGADRIRDFLKRKGGR